MSDIFNECPSCGDERRCGNHGAKRRGHPAGFPHHWGGTRQKTGTKDRKMGCLGSGSVFYRKNCASGVSVFTCNIKYAQFALIKFSASAF